MSSAGASSTSHALFTSHLLYSDKGISTCWKAGWRTGFSRNHAGNLMKSQAFVKVFQLLLDSDGSVLSWELFSFCVFAETGKHRCEGNKTDSKAMVLNFYILRVLMGKCQLLGLLIFWLWKVIEQFCFKELRNTGTGQRVFGIMDSYWNLVFSCKSCLHP